ncbi:MAG: HNH endonuclease, partial [Candidatus Methanomethyliaceae archaeon]
YELLEIGKEWLKANKVMGHCARCKRPLPKGRRVWCSEECYNWWRETFVWGMVRERIMKRDNYTCQMCGRSLHDIRTNAMSRLTVHHIRPWHISKDYSDSNLITVCPKCHSRLHSENNWKLIVASRECKKLDEV